MKHVSIKEYASFVKDGVWTDAFRAAVADLAAAGGGKLTVPAGTYPTSSVEYCSDMTLELQEGAVLDFINDGVDHPVVFSRYEGVDRDVYMPLIYGRHLKNVTLCGKGTIEGNGEFWWKRRLEWVYPRPKSVVFQDCENVVIRDVTIRNSPCWTVVPLRSRNILVDGISVFNPYESPNTDGIDPDSCQDVEIRNCYLDVGDDCIAIKSGTEYNKEFIPSENIYVHDCRMVRGHCGVGIGSEMSGGVRNVRVEDCEFTETDRGLRLKTRRGRGGFVDGVSFVRVKMKKVQVPFVINMRYWCGPDGFAKKVSDTVPYPADKSTPSVRNIHLEDFVAEDTAVAALYISGLAESPIEGVSLKNVQITMDRHATPGFADAAIDAPYMWRAGLILKFTKGLQLDNVTVKNVMGLTNLFSDCENVMVNGKVYDPGDVEEQEYNEIP